MLDIGDYVRENGEHFTICIIVALNKKLGLMEVRPPTGSTWIVVNINKWRLFKKGER